MNRSLPEEYRECLNAIFIRRAYWAMNSVHNKIFFNEASKTYAVPDREDSIIAMLTKQHPSEVALLRITRDILEKAEREQPERKLDIVKQMQGEIRTEEKEIQQPLAEI